MNKTEIWKQRKQRPKGERNWQSCGFAEAIYTVTICCPRPNLRGYVKGYRPFRISTESLSRGSRSTAWKLNIMTPKELYDWAVEQGAQDYDIMVDGDAIDYQLPEIDERLKIIEIIR